ncbi:MAG: AI-2E family transporter [Lachnospiraceae bacterium]|nr:AI-2E family transporter [Lachnospiraceae bacterium]
MNNKKHTNLKIALNLIFPLVALALILWLVPRVLMFFMPFVIAGIIAWIVTPLVNFMEKHLPLKRKASMIVVIVLVIGLVVLALYGLCSLLINMLGSFLYDLPELWNELLQDSSELEDVLQKLLFFLPEEQVLAVLNFLSSSSDTVGSALNSLSSFLLDKAAGIAASAAGQLGNVFISVIMCLVAVFFFVLDRDWLGRGMARLPWNIRHGVEVIRNSIAHSIGGYFKAQLQIEVWIYLLLTVCLGLLRVRYFPLAAFGIAILDMLPVFGTTVILAPWAVICLLNGEIVKGVCLIALTALAQLVRQMIQPKYVGESLGMPPIPTLFLLYAGYRLGGVTGMIVAVPLGILAVALYKEGMFRGLEDSLTLLVERFRNFRQYDEEEKEEIQKYRDRNEQ